MDSATFKKLVIAMRQAQKEFFRTKSQTALERAKVLEKQVDQALEDAGRQSTLWDD